MTFINNLKGYKIVLAPNAKKILLKINSNDAHAIGKKLKDLISGAQNLDIKKLISTKYPTYRLRVGCYRVLYEIHKQEIIIKVIRIAHRKEIYKKTR